MASKRPPRRAHTIPRRRASAVRRVVGGRAGALPPEIIATKLNVPQPRADLVRRARLVAQLDAGLARPVTLVSAPAGFGKTTLISDWLQYRMAANGGSLRVVWLSLDDGDSEPGRFMRYIAVALHRLTPRASETILTLLQGPTPPRIQVLAGILINDLAQLRQECLLVLDDYHVVRERAIHEAVTFLLDHAPRRFHLLIATRQDPPLPLARLRARNAMVEVRQADLRFRADEAAAFLQETMGLTVSPAEVRTLEARTEGWIAGLQMAALSMQGETDVAEFVAAFSGSDRYILDYLIEEVLSRQSDAVQDFLVRTSILDTLSVPLCEVLLEPSHDADAGTGPSGRAQDILGYLERANLFVAPVNAERRWYRYHPLFADLLRLRLRQTRPELLPELHRRASAWYEQAGLPVDAIRHALAGSDVESAARLIEQHTFPLMTRESRTVLRWLDGLPAELTRGHPYLALSHAAALAITHDLDGAESWLDEIERSLLPTLPPAQSPVFQGWAIGIRGFIAHCVGDMERAVALARKALTLLPPSDRLARPSALFRAANEFLISGDVGPATERAVASLAGSDQKLDNLYMTIRNIALRAQLQVMQGRLHRAAATYARAAEHAPGQSGVDVAIRGLAYHFGLGALLLERNELDAAERLLGQGMDALTDTTIMLPADLLVGHAAMAGVRQARGDGAGALGVMDGFMEVARRRHFVPPVVAQAAGVVARLRFRQGDLTGASRWAEGSGLGVGDEPRYAQEAEYLTLARVLIAQGRAAETPVLLERLLGAAKAGGRMGSVIEILIVQALALQAQGQTEGALKEVSRALSLAEPEGYVRLFADEGPPMEALLRRVAARGMAWGYVATLRQAIREVGPDGDGLDGRRPGSLPEPLTGREREVLRFLAAEASNTEIARRLVLTVSTVKTHVHHILSKLNVRNRAQAIARARELHLL